MRGPAAAAGAAAALVSGPPAGGRAQALITALQLAPHPEGGWYREIFRGAGQVRPANASGPVRHTLTSIDFLLLAGQASAWHRVAADEAWHLLEGGPLRLWLVPPDLSRVLQLDLAPVDAQGHRPRHVVPAMWWQAAEPVPALAATPTASSGDDRVAGEDGFAYVGASVGPGFDFADFTFGRDDRALQLALQALRPDTLRLL
ncbi:MAG: cupin domain-containing protein [Microbacteriaceae bacterium]|nr:cupin domain-containing protein [Burkholderiaceae bacterium]